MRWRRIIIWLREADVSTTVQSVQTANPERRDSIHAIDEALTHWAGKLEHITDPKQRHATLRIIDQWLDARGRWAEIKNLEQTYREKQ